MTGAVLYPTGSEVFEVIVQGVERVIDTGRRLPEWPFRRSRGHVDICQFSMAIEDPFGAVLQALVDDHRDQCVSLVVLDPEPGYYREYYGSYPGFTVPGDEIEGSFWDLVAHEPGGDPTGAVTYTANVVALVGSSGAWAVWAERSWDLAIVVSPVAGGRWTASGVPFVLAAEALAIFTEPDFKVPLAPAVRAAFLDNFRQHGTGQ